MPLFELCAATGAQLANLLIRELILEVSRVVMVQPGGGHCVAGHRYQPVGRGGLGDDAVLLRLPLHTGAGEAGAVRHPPAVFHHHAAHQKQPENFVYQLEVNGALTLPDLGGHAILHPRGHRCGHHKQ